jgi:hypothetical protein
LGELGPELRKLAQNILDAIDPAVRAAASRASGSGVGTGKCQQVWCPVCALAALVTGERHPLLTVIAEHSVALLEVIQAIVEDVEGLASSVPPDPPPDSGVPAGSAAGVSVKSRYEPIAVTVEE